MKLYLIMNNSSDKEDMVRTIFSGCSGLMSLESSRNAQEAMNTIKKENPRLVVLDGNVFRGKGLELLLPILRKREMSAAVFLGGSGKAVGVTSISVDLPSDFSSNSSNVLALLTQLFDV